MASMAENYGKLKNNLNKLKLYQFETHIDEYVECVNDGTMNMIEALYKMTEFELQAKETRILQSSVKTANFPFLKTMDDFDFSFQPSINKSELLGMKDMRFVDNKENIIFIGSPGVGKTHLSVSLGIEAAYNHRSTYFIQCNDLIMNLKRAQLENRLDQKLKIYAKYKVLIIDEVGFLPMDDQSSKLFFQLISMRYEKHSTIITTNKPLSQWAEIFGDPVLANAILDRILHHSKIIKIIGKSYRTREIQKELSEQGGKSE